MSKQVRILPLLRLGILSLVISIIITAPALRGDDEDLRQGRMRVATGAWITPLAAPGSALYKLHTDFRADDNADAANAVSTALSPDGTTLLILTSGYNTGFSKEDGTPIVYPVLDPATGQPTGQTTGNAEWLFVYDVTGPAPVQKQKVNLPITYVGLTWDATGTKFYVSGGANDIVYPFKKVGTAFQLDPPFIVPNTGGQLDTTPAGPQMQNFGLAPFPVIAGLALSSDGGTLYAADFENDSVSLVDTKTRQVVGKEVFSAPGGKAAIGEYPYWIAVRAGKNSGSDKIFVSSQRDGQVVVFDNKKGWQRTK
jgi:DNA-binding beta-propeller fold protein YncE